MYDGCLVVVPHKNSASHNIIGIGEFWACGNATRCLKIQTVIKSARSLGGCDWAQNWGCETRVYFWSLIGAMFLVTITTNGREDTAIAVGTETTAETTIGTMTGDTGHPEGTMTTEAPEGAAGDVAIKASLSVYYYIHH